MSASLGEPAKTDDPAPPLLEARGVTRRFGSFVALENVNFGVRAGGIRALLGENGAGKSTLMNILSGLLRPSVGTVAMCGAPTRFRSPADAAARGVGMVHQHFLLVPTMTVAENLLLGASPSVGKLGAFSYPICEAVAQARAVADSLGWQIPFDARAGELPVGTQQRIEILKALRGETRVLIFDEPTAVLTPTETPELFANIRALAASGRGIVFISHKLDEVLSLAQDVTVLRRGRVVLETTTAETDARTLARAMVGEQSEMAARLATGDDGRDKNDDTQPDTLDDAPPVLSVQNLFLRNRRGDGVPLLQDISFAVRAGEIFGVAGVDGNGQSELSDCLAGLARPTGGTITVGKTVPKPHSLSFLRAGVATIPADRQTRGLALPMSLAENFALGVWRDRNFRVGPLLRWQTIGRRADDLIRRFDIRTSRDGARSPTRSLSGGNQQKVVIGRALSDNPRVVVAVNPTRGLDVGAIANVHDALRAARRGGAAIVLISTELEEVRALATSRVAVLFEGRFVDTVAPRTTTAEAFGLLMGGATQQPATAVDAKAHA